MDLGPLATVSAYEQAVHDAMGNGEVDAIIAIFACVGECDPKTVGRGIRRGVLRAERVTGVSKPALLCLMGAAGAVRFGVDGSSGETGQRHVFPSYRFPESAALALSRAVQYGSFRSQPGGRLRWFEDADGAAARQEVQAMLVSTAEEVIWVEGEQAWRILRAFGIQKGDCETASLDADTVLATLEVGADPSFGPLVRILRADKPPVVRITPLTDRDVREIVEAAEIPAECNVQELLGRISQLIEELPWLCGMQAEIRSTRDDSGKWGVRLDAGVKIGFCHHESGPP